VLQPVKITAVSVMVVIVQWTRSLSGVISPNMNARKSWEHYKAHLHLTFVLAVTKALFAILAKVKRPVGAFPWSKEIQVVSNKLIFACVESA
jgi:hypothetical protein